MPAARLQGSTVAGGGNSGGTIFYDWRNGTSGTSRQLGGTTFYYASQMIAAGRELHFIQQQLGHHSPAFTLSVYGHLLPRDRRGEVDCLDDPKLSRGDVDSEDSTEFQRVREA